MLNLAQLSSAQNISFLLSAQKVAKRRQLAAALEADFVVTSHRDLGRQKSGTLDGNYTIMLTRIGCKKYKSSCVRVWEIICCPTSRVGILEPWTLWFGHSLCWIQKRSMSPWCRSILIHLIPPSGKSATATCIVVRVFRKFSSRHYPFHTKLFHW